MKKNKSTHYQIQVIPNGSGSIQSFSITKGFLRILIWGGTSIFLISFILFIYAGDITLQLMNSKKTKTKINQLKIENQTLKKSFSNLAQIKSQHSDMMKIAEIFKLRKNKSDHVDENFILKLDENKEIEKYVQKLKESYLDFTDSKNPTPNIQPVIGIISKSFSTDDNHPGLDIAAMLNDPIYATAPGIVTQSGWEKDLGKTITIDHSHGYKTKYAHLNKLLAKKGDYVDRGQFIGMVGVTGNTTGPHLHYEVMKDSQQVDPEKYFEDDFTHTLNEQGHNGKE